VKPADIISLRRTAESSVADMPEGELKVKAFEVILKSLLTNGLDQPRSIEPAQPVRPVAPQSRSTLTERIDLLAEEGFFSEPRSLGEIQSNLAAHGWHYPQTNLSSPLIRLVRQRRLRRIQLAEGTKKVWKYSLP
jgi:hypothetical protein